MSAGEHRRPTILFATIAAGGGHVATARAMAEAVEHHYPGRFELRVSDYMKDLGIAGLDRFHKDSWRRALRYPILARVGQRVIDAFPRLTIAVQRRILRGFARAAAADLGEDPPLLIVSNHGLITTGLAEAKRLYGLEVLILDALRYTPHPSHFSLSEALALIERVAPKRAVLTNLHTDLDYARLAAELPSGIEPAFDGLVLTA